MPEPVRPPHRAPSAESAPVLTSVGPAREAEPTSVGHRAGGRRPGQSIAPEIPDRRGRTLVWAATMIMAGFCLLFLISTPAFYAADEVFHFDRVIGAEHGEFAPTPGQFHLTYAAGTLQPTLSSSLVNLGSKQFDEFLALERSARPSVNSLGGNIRKDETPTNYMSQHPPLYYMLMGGLTWLIPGADDYPGDLELMVMRLFNIALVLPLPLLFRVAAKRMFGSGMVVDAAAFLPLLLPGLMRGAATVNNDNLAILIGAGIAVCCAGIINGDRTLRTALWVSGLAVAGSLTKGTILFALGLIPLSYLLQFARTRRLPELRALLTLAVGTVLAAAWWIVNEFRFGTFQPAGLVGAELTASAGGVRRPGVTPDYGAFVYGATVRMSARFWGTIGVLDPPAPPDALVLVLDGLLLVSIIMAVIQLRRTVVGFWLFPLLFFALYASVAFTAFQHYRHYLSKGALQGRYLYTTMFGGLISVAVVLKNALRGAQRFTPLVIAGIGTVLAVWFLTIMDVWLWMGDPVTSTVWQGIRRLFSFAPLPGPLTLAIGLAAALAVVVGLAVTLGAAGRQEDAPEPETAPDPVQDSVLTA